MMVNRSFADAYMPGASAVGRHLVQPFDAYLKPSLVSGIVGDAREMGMDQAPGPVVYWCWPTAQPGQFFLVRTHGDPRLMAATIRRKMHEIAPARSVYDLTPLTEHISDAYAENRLRTILLAFFAATAVLLACVGLYGTLSYMVNCAAARSGTAAGAGRGARADCAAVPDAGADGLAGRVRGRPGALGGFRQAAGGHAVRRFGDRRDHAGRSGGDDHGRLSDSFARAGGAGRASGAHAGSAGRVVRPH